MDEPESSQNPYQSPKADLQGDSASNLAVAKRGRSSLGFVRLIVVPFFLAHVAFWPAMLLLSRISYSKDRYGIADAWGALWIAAAIGFIYGVFISRGLAKKSWLVSALYGAGELLWFSFCIIAPCSTLILIS